GMWVETDCILPLGESLVRQLLYGQKHFIKEFGKPTRIAWLPDSFGYPASLPQILRKSGIEIFFTHKLIWNKTNKFPYTNFLWRGIDNTVIYTHLIRGGYGVDPTPKAILDLWKDYGEKNIAPITTLIYGYGDGGGGPNEEMLEKINILSRSPIIPKISHMDPEEYLSKIMETGDELPVWSGELYLEIHRGTYTANTLVKKLVRRAEILLRNMEALIVFNKILGIDMEELSNTEKYWKTVLKHMFHDVLPGTSKYEVYKEVYEELGRIIASLEEKTRRLLENISDTLGLGGYMFFNPIQWSRTEYIEVELPKGIVIGDEYQVLSSNNDSWRILAKVDTPGYSIRNYTPKNTGSSINNDKEPRLTLIEDKDMYIIENDFYKIVIGKDGIIRSIHDKALEENIIAKPSNKLIAYYDLPEVWDAWDIDEDYKELYWEVKDIIGSKILEKGPLRITLYFKKRFRSSTIEYRINIYRDLRRIELTYDIDWHERNVLLKTWFYPSIHAKYAYFMIPYGVVERPIEKNTSWEKAMYEVPLTGWLDIHSRNRGFAVITSIPRGVSVDPHAVGVSLLKSSIQPNPLSDTGRLSIKIAIMSYKGASYSKVVEEYYKFLYPLLYIEKRSYRLNSIERSIQFIGITSNSSILETIKLSEDQDGVILRLYEILGENDIASIKIPHISMKECLETDLLENPVYRLDCNRNKIKVKMRPFEIKTIKLSSHASYNKQ
ncbi:MAG: alpha-mannosidase, partial [Desulfurococcales archaeon]|nr:alpha-mannosidase [Desulfurococcales archaeon]